MKKRSLSLLIFLLSLLVGYGQQKITGFGKLQLGMSVKDIPELMNPILINSEVNYIQKAYKNTSSISYELVADTLDAYNAYGEFDQRVRCFQIGSYYVTETIKLEDIELKFFDDSLYEITVNGTDLSDILKTKYGAPKVDEKDEDHTYVNGYGNESIKTDKTFHEVFNTNIPNVSCVHLLMSWYNDHGEENFVNQTTLKNSKYDIRIETETNLMKKRIQDKKDEEKKKSVEGF
jgi:hypothetical protein